MKILTKLKHYLLVSSFRGELSPLSEANKMLSDIMQYKEKGNDEKNTIIFKWSSILRSKLWEPILLFLDYLKQYLLVY